MVLAVGAAVGEELLGVGPHPDIFIRYSFIYYGIKHALIQCTGHDFIVIIQFRGRDAGFRLLVSVVIERASRLSWHLVATV